MISILQKAIKYDTYHSTSKLIFELIPCEQKVLDVGCGTGKLAENLRLKKACYVVGLEKDESAVNLARDRCDKIIVSSAEDFGTLPLETNFFDVIIFADVLEHLVHPEQVLLGFKKYLSKDGCIVISIPNVANWYLRFNLLSGKWNYRETGLLDKTHIRFFTLKTIKELICACGLTIDSYICTSGLNSDRWHIALRMANLWKSLLGYQFVIMVHMTNEENKASVI